MFENTFSSIFISGQLFDLGPGDSSHYCIFISTDSTDYKVFVPLSVIANKYEVLGISQEDVTNITNNPSSYQIAPSTIVAINSNNYQLNISLDPSSPQQTDGKYTTVIAVDINFDNPRLNPTTDLLKVYQQKNGADPKKAKAGDWPDDDVTSPFTPVAVPTPYRHTRIGYATFDIPIQYISNVRKSTERYFREDSFLRFPGKIKTGLGKAWQTFTISYTAHNPEEIEKGVKEVFEQLNLFPFLSTEGGPFGIKNGELGPIPYQAIAARNWSISTLPGEPNSLNVEITFDPFSWENSIPTSDGDYPRMCFDDAFCWPLFKIWCQTREKSQYSGEPFNQKFTLSFPDDITTGKFFEIFQNTNSIPTIVNDLSALKNLQQAILPENYGAITSENVKEILGYQNSSILGSRDIVIKVDNKDIFDELVNGDLGRPTSDNPWFVGLIDWSKLKGHNFLANNGGSLSYDPMSAIQTTTYLQDSFNQGNTIKPTTENPLGIYDLSTDNGSLSDQLKAIYPTNTGNKKTDDLNTQLLNQRLNNPQTYYGIVLRINSNRSGEALDNKITKILNKFSTKATIQYQNLNSIINDSFQAAKELTFVFKNDNEDIIIEKIAGTKGHDLAIVNGMLDPLPYHWHMGTKDAQFIIQGKCFTQDAVNTIEGIKAEFERRALLRPSYKYTLRGLESKLPDAYSTAFLRVENEIFQLMGVNFVMPLIANIQTVDGQPGVWDFTLSFVEFDPKQLVAEEVKFLETEFQNLAKPFDYGTTFAQQSANQSNPIIDRGIEFLGLQTQLAKEEVYKDLQLPTKFELAMWIQACVKIANAWNQTSATNLSKQEGKTLGRKYVKIKNALHSLSDDELALFKHIKQFLPSASKQIAGWDANQNISLISPNAYVDPDFFIYYEADQGFGSIFDIATESFLGKRVGHEAAGRTSDDGLAPVSGIRKIDPRFGSMASVYDVKYNSLDSEYLKTANETTIAQRTFHPYKETYIQLQEQARSDLDAKPNRWYDPSKLDYTISTPDSNNQNNVKLSQGQIDQALKGIIPPGTPSYIPDSSNTKQNTDVQQLEQESLGLGQYLDLAWRQKVAIKAASQGANIGTLQPYTGTPDYVFFLSYANISTTENKTITDLEKVIGDWINLMLVENDSTNDQEFNDYGLDGSRNGHAYLVNTAKANANYSYWLNQNRATALDSISNRGIIANSISAIQDSPQDRVIKYYNYIDWDAGQYSIDPNIIRAFFMRRDGFGFEDRASLDKGFGKIANPNTTDQTTNNAQNIDLACQLYSNYIGEFEIPSLALAKLEILTNTSLRQKYAFNNNGQWQLNDTISNDFNNVADSLNGNAFNNSAPELIAAAFVHCPDVGAIVSYYQTEYYEMCRSIGSYYNNVSAYYDPYFFPFALPILIDFGDNKGKTLDLGNFNPMQSSTVPSLMSLDTDLKAADPNLKNQDPSHSNLELDVQTATKIKSALDPTSETAIYGTLHDLRKHSCFGRLLNCFPTFQVLLINEGFYWQAGNKKLWDQFYTRTGVTEIEIHKSKYIPAHHCTITFSNMFFNLSAYSQMEALEQQLAIKRNEKLAELFNQPLKGIAQVFNDYVAKGVPADFIKMWQDNHLKQIALHPGCRIQVRMGFGSAGHNLPIIFNGTIVECPINEGTMTLFCESDGMELDKPNTTKLVPSGNSFAYADGGAYGIGKSPSNIVTECLVGCSLWDAFLGGNFRDFSKGVAHFGEIYYNTNYTANPLTGFNISSASYNPAEVAINIYNDRLTQLEQGVNSIRNWFNVAAIYNWDNDQNNFSIEVQEPTPWKVINVCKHACMDFVASAEPFANRSTLFFGKWWWPFNYTYDNSILQLGLQAAPGQKNLNIVNSGPSFAKVSSNTATNGTPDSSYYGPNLYYGPGFEGGKSAANSRKAIQTNIPTSKIPYEVPIQPNDPKRASKEIWNNWPLSVRQQVLTLYSIPIFSITPEGEAGYLIQYEDKETISISLIGNSILKGVEGGAYTKPNIGPIQPPTLENPFDVVTNYNSISQGRMQDGSKITSEAQLQQQPSLTQLQAQPDNLNFMANVDALVERLKWKPYMQAYIAHSAINLLSNNIELTKKKVITDAMGVHKFNGLFGRQSVTKTITFSADCNIEPIDRVTAMIDTGLALTYLQSGSKPLANFATSWIPVVGDAVEGTPTTPAVQNSVVSGLVEGIREMYAGWFAISGQPTIKPHDLILITDHINDIKGPVFVKEVIHRMSVNDGFLTMIQPECCAFPQSCAIGMQMIESLAMGPLHRIGALMMYKTAVAATWGAIKGNLTKAGKLQEIGELEEYNFVLKKGKKSKNPELKNLYKRVAQKEKELKELEAKLTAQAEKGTGVFRLIPKYLDKEKIIQRELSQRRISFVNKLKKEFDAAISILTDSNEIKKAKKILNNLLDIKKTRKLTPTEQTQFNEALSTIDDALEDFSTTRLGLNDAALKLFQHTNYTLVDENVYNYIQDVWNEATAFPRSVLNAAGKFVDNIATQLNKSLTAKDQAGINSAADSASRAAVDDAEAMSKMPTGEVAGKTFLDKIYRSVTGKTAAADVAGDATKLTKGIKDAAILKLGRGIEEAKEIAQGARLLKYMSSGTVIGLALNTLQLVAGSAVIDAINARLQARQAVKMIPLMAGRVPFVAGIRGHQGMVIGDSPSWQTELLQGWLSPKGVNSDNAFSATASKTLGFLAAFAGIEVPENVTTEQDQAYMDAYYASIGGK